MTVTGAPGQGAGVAVEAALALLRFPDRLQAFRLARLPGGVIDVIRIAAGDAALCEAEAQRCHEPASLVREACELFVHSVLFEPDSDHFRVLGVDPEAPVDVARSHFRLLQKWLHPDRDPEAWVSAYAERVNIAWSVVRNPERRAAYAESLAPRPASALALVGVGPSRPESFRGGTVIPSRWARRLPALILAGTGVIVFVGLGAHWAGQRVLVDDLRQASTERPSPAGPETSDRATELESADTPSADAIGQPVRDGDLAVVPRPGEAPERGGPEPAEPGAVPVAMPAAAAPPSPSAEARSETVADAVPTGAEAAPVPLTDPGLARSEDAPGTAQPASDAVPPAAPETPAVAASPIEARDDRGSVLTAPTAAAPPASPEPVIAPDAGASAPMDREVVALDADAQDPVAEPLQPARPAVAVDVIDAAAELAPSAPVGVAAAVAPAPATVPVAADGEGGREQFPTAADLAEARNILRRYSEAYQAGDVQRLVVLFQPNARTPSGNLIDLHQRYERDIAGSSRRSLEFREVDWRVVGQTLEGQGRYEWALRPRGFGRGSSQEGTFAVTLDRSAGSREGWLIASLVQDGGP